MNRRDISAGRAFVSLYVKQGGFQRGLENISKRLRSFGATATALGAGIGAAGAAMITPLAAAVSSFVREGSELDKIATQTGATVEQLTQLRFAAEQLNIEPDDLIGGIEELNIRLGETVRDGTGPLAEAFDQLGLDAEQLANTPLPERIGAIGDALAGIQNETTRGFLSDEIFGGDAFKILPLLRQGSQGIADLADEADRLGATRSGEAVNAAAMLGKTFAQVREVAGGLVFEVGSALAPAIQEVAEVVVNVVNNARQWVSENASLVRILGAVALGVMAVGGAIAAVGLAGTALGIVFSGLATIAGGIGAAISLVASPVGLIVAGLAAGAAAWVAFTESGQRAAGLLINGFNDIFGTFQDTIGGIGDALMSGDFALAGEIAMAGLRLAVLQGLDVIANLIGGTWGKAIAGIGKSLLDGDFTKAWNQGLDLLMASWRTLTSWVVDAAANMAKAVVNAWQNAVGSLSKGMLHLASQDSPLGKLMSKVLGVDVAAEIERANKLGTNLDPLAAMKADVDRQINAMADGAKDSIDNYASSFEESAAAARERLGDIGGDGPGSGLGGDIKAAKEDLDRKSAEATRLAEERRRKARERAEDADKIQPPGGGGREASVSGSFSAGAIALLAGGGGPQKQMANDMRKLAAEQKQAIEWAKKTYAVLLDRLKPAVFGN